VAFPLAGEGSFGGCVAGRRERRWLWRRKQASKQQNQATGGKMRGVWQKTNKHVHNYTLMTFDYVWCGRKEDSYAPPLPELHPFLFSSASKVKRSLGWMAVEEEEENMI
jgi:hypothetical protein